MELSENVYETLVGIGSLDGRAFTGLNGNRELTIAGNANAANWAIMGT